MRKALALILSLVAAVPVHAQAQAVMSYETIEETEVVLATGSTRFVAAKPAAIPQGIAKFGPFRVLDAAHAALVDVTDTPSPAQFAAMLAAFPNIRTLELVECPGTLDDRANLKVGRMIRKKGIATHVPAGGSVRSGGVELFLAGARRMAEPGAEFAVHSWEDENGRQAKDFAANAPENRLYITYYVEMGMTPIEARAFYDMTNAVPNEDARWMDSAQMAQWVRMESPEFALSPLDSARALR